MWPGSVAAIRHTFVLGAHPRFCLRAAGPLSSVISDRDLFLIDGDAADGKADVDILCLSHLRWDFVFQRPQHLLSRLAARYPVVFVE